MDFAAHVVFVSVFADRAFCGVSSSGFYRFFCFYQDGRYRCYRFDNGSTGERGGGWKRKSGSGSQRSQSEITGRDKTMEGEERTKTGRRKARGGEKIEREGEQVPGPIWCFSAVVAEHTFH